VAASAGIDDLHYTTPLYHKTEAAHIIAVPTQTFRDWAVGYARKRLDGSHVVSAPIVTALASQQLQTDGAEVLWDFGRRSGDPADQDIVDGLVVVRSGQQVFRPQPEDVAGDYGLTVPEIEAIHRAA